MKARNFALVLALAPALAAQSSVHVVAPTPGPGVDFTTVQAAVDAAPNGGIVLVKSGEYPPFSILNHAVHVVADVGATVKLVSGVVQIAATPLNASSSLRGLDFTSAYPPVVDQSPGLAWFEDCRFVAGLKLNDKSNTALARCTAYGWAYEVGLRLNSTTPGNTCRAWSFDCDWRGKPGSVTSGIWFESNGYSGIVCNNAELFLSGGTALGGDSTTWTDGVTCVQGAAGQGAFVSSGSLVHYIGTWFSGGVASTGCGAPPLGGEALVVVPGSTVVALPGSARSLVASSPVREGGAATVDVHGAPGEYALVVWSEEFQLGQYTSEWRAPLLVAAPQRVIALGLLPASGDAQLSFTLSELGPGVEGARAVAQGAFIDPSTLTVQLGAASELIALDASL